MKNMMYYIDELILEKVFQKLADKLHDYIGVNCLSLAKFLIGPYFIANIYLAYKLQSFILFFGIMMYFFTLGSSIVYHFVLMGLEKKYNDIKVESEVNPMKLVQADARVRLLARIFFISAIIIPPILLFEFNAEFTKEQAKNYYFSYILADMSEFVLLYFMACTPKPKGISKVRQFADRFAETLGSVFTPEPVPVPVKN